MATAREKLLQNSTNVAKATALETGVLDDKWQGERLANASISQILPPLLEDPIKQNAFLTRLYNKFIFSDVIRKEFKNPMDNLKKPRIAPYGDTYENVVYNPAKAIAYDSKDDNILSPATPDAFAEYIRVNRKDKYPVRLPREVIMQGFANEQNFSEFMSGAIDTLYNGDNIDEFKLMKKIPSDMYNGGFLPAITISSNIEDLTISIINYLKWFRFPSAEYNQYSQTHPNHPVITWCSPSDVVLIVTVDMLTSIKVKSLATYFNLSEVEFAENIVEIDHFDVPGLKAVVCDRAYFQVRDTVYQMDSFERADDLSAKTYLHHWQTMTSSLFANAIAFVEEGTTPAKLEETKNE